MARSRCRLDGPSDQDGYDSFVPEDTPPQTPPMAPASVPAGSPAQRMTRLKKASKVYGLVSDILTPQRLGLLAAVAVLLGFGWLGGWNEAVAETDDIPVVKAGDAHAAKPFEITVKKAFHADKLSPILPAMFFANRNQQRAMVPGPCASRNFCSSSAVHGVAPPF